MGGVSLSDRIISSISYLTMGIFSIIWIIFVNLTKKRMTPFVVFNLYQAIFLSIALAIISMIYSIAINILVVVPILGTLVKKIDLFFNQTPLYFGYTITGAVVTILLFYLIILCLIGRRPHLPYISNIVNGNFGGWIWKNFLHFRCF